MNKIPSIKKTHKTNRIIYNPTSHQKDKYNQIRKEIEKKYSIKLNSRNIIIKNLISTLTHNDFKNYKIPEINFFIIRTDIKNFFPSINKHKLYKKLNNSSVLSNESMNTIKEMIFSPKIKGLPIGLPFSNVLAELYLEDFDLDILLSFNPNFYFRYVDDIIFLDYTLLSRLNLKKLNENLEKNLSSIFSKHKLNSNSKKTNIKIYDSETDTEPPFEFDYLGYNFLIKNHTLNIRISNSKYQKILNNIYKCFRIYSKSHKQKRDFWLLYYRIMNILYGITSKNSKNKKIRFGLGFNYNCINDPLQIELLIEHIKKLTFIHKLTSKQRFKIFLLIHFEKGENSLALLKKRMDYTRLTKNQLKKIFSQLNIPYSKVDKVNIEVLFDHIYKDF